MVFRGGAGGWLEAGLPCAGSGKLPGMVPKERGKQIVSAVDFRKPKTEKEETDRKERRNPARQNGGYGLAVDIGTTTLAAALIALPEGEAAGGGDLRQQPAGSTGRMCSRGFCRPTAERLRICREIVRRDLKSLASDICRMPEFQRNRLRRQSSREIQPCSIFLPASPARDWGRRPSRRGTFPSAIFQRETETLSCCRNFPPLWGPMWWPHLRAGNHGTGRTGALSGSCTNGEMALWDGRRLYTASTAAGPAFEGGKLKNGAALCSGGDLRGQKRARKDSSGDPSAIRDRWESVAPARCPPSV